MMNDVNINAEKTEVNYVYLDTKKWKKHPDVKSTVFDRFLIQSPFNEGEMTEVLSEGTWDNTWCEITNGVDILKKNTEYRFVFWLNGGENDRDNEVCQLHIIFTDDPVGMPISDWNSKLCYKLNREYIKPLKRFDGWNLYSIPFKTGDKEFVQLRFVAQRAPMAVMAAEAPECYADLPNRIDPFADERPQRHNIVFGDGWPAGKKMWYSTESLRERHRNDKGMGGASIGENTAENSDMAEVISRVIEDVLSSEDMAKQIAENLDAAVISENIKLDNELIAELAAGMIDTEEIAVQTAEHLYANGLFMERLKNELLEELRK